ncbi:hypothetical protein C4D60_Mb06t13180 [Musa balbisiana]|uniref:Uncharacterized protein n=1 Tax=Musa balbisiana TaxID=52838 RepID=A0A4S8IMQ9_MUSBA|nr:hypothetical protein C4D60_Mb06t13180 [Musa balbisiana]
MTCRYVGDEGQLDLVYWHRNRQMRHFGVEIMGVISMNGEHQVDMSSLVRRYFSVHLLMLAVNFYDRNWPDRQQYCAAVAGHDRKQEDADGGEARQIPPERGIGGSGCLSFRDRLDLFRSFSSAFFLIKNSDLSAMAESRGPATYTFPLSPVTRGLSMSNPCVDVNS